MLCACVLEAEGEGFPGLYLRLLVPRPLHVRGRSCIPGGVKEWWSSWTTDDIREAGAVEFLGVFLEKVPLRPSGQV